MCTCSCVCHSALAADVADTLLACCSIWSRVASEDMPAITAGLHERWEQQCQGCACMRTPHRDPAP